MFSDIVIGVYSIFDSTLLVYTDVSRGYDVYFQQPATPVIRGIITFHDDLMYVRVYVTVFVAWIMGTIVYHFDHKKNAVANGVVHGAVIEVIWTMVPALILVGIAIPSFALLYSVDEVVDPSVTIKIIGHQWYWSYEYSDYTNNDTGDSIAFDSYIVPDDELVRGQYRLLEVDNRVRMPIDTHIRLVITAADVLHCWTIPSFGVKLDACPGRLNQVSLYVMRIGTYFGQCSEICGVNHGFIPIVVEAVSMKDYITWLDRQMR
jgi:cytochrome c oxidase subunit 2